MRSVVTGPVKNIASTPIAADARAVAADELVEVRWLNRRQIDELMPDLFERFGSTSMAGEYACLQWTL